MTRTPEDDTALRAELNSLIEAYNQGEREAAKNGSIAIWNKFFRDKSTLASDVEILDTLWGFLTEQGEERYAAEVLGTLAVLRHGPLIAKLDDSVLNAESRYLLSHANNKTSQSGEDGILEKIFDVIGEQNQWCVEFGAYDGKLHSNTYTLVADRGWDGVLIEGDSDRYDEMVRNFEGNTRAHMLRALVGFDPDKDSLDHILSNTAIPDNPDLVSIDIDGNDWHIWYSLQNYRPRVVIIEFNPTVPNDVMFVQSRDPGESQGCSLRALIALGKAKGYELVCVTNFNGIFVIEDEFEKLGIEDNSIGAMYRPLMDGRIFHGYDSKIFTVGMDHLNWTREGQGSPKRTIRPDELQLPPES